LARHDVHYVVTEFGIAYLFGKSMQERALALIEITHPKFREELLAQAREAHLVRSDQRMMSPRQYLIEEERHVDLADQRQILIRPARASDAMGLKDLFHALSAQDVYTRFFRRMTSLSYDDASVCAMSISTATSLSLQSRGRAKMRRSSAPAPIS
jgi:hypothetical protein